MFLNQLLPNHGKESLIIEIKSPTGISLMVGLMFLQTYIWEKKIEKYFCWYQQRRNPRPFSFSFFWSPIPVKVNILGPNLAAQITWFIHSFIHSFHEISLNVFSVFRALGIQQLIVSQQYSWSLSSNWGRRQRFSDWWLMDEIIVVNALWKHIEKTTHPDMGDWNASWRTCL